MTLEPTDLDRRIGEEKLEKFLPKQLFDAHLHFFNDDHCLSQPDDDPPEYGPTVNCPFAVFDRDAIQQTYQMLFPGREVHCLAFGWVYRRIDFDKHNEFTAAQVVDDPKSRALMLVHPREDCQSIAPGVSNPAAAQG